MSGKRNDRTHSKRRWGGSVAATGLGAAAGALLAAAMGTAPIARADDLSDIFNDVQGAISAGQTDFGMAATDFGQGDIADGLAFGAAGLNDDFLATSDDVLTGLADAVTGNPVFGGITFAVPLPSTDLATTLTEFQGDLSGAQTEFADAVTDLSNGSFPSAVIDFLIAGDVAVVSAPELLFIGGVDSLLAAL